MKIKRKTQVLRRFEDIAPGRLEKQFGNKVKLIRSAGCMAFECPVCGIPFTRKAAEAKRNENSYCGSACAHFAQRRQVAINCRICGVRFTVRQSVSKIITCCGNVCKRKAASLDTSKMDKTGWKTGMFKRGQDSPAAKLTWDDVDSIINDTRVHRIIASEYGVTRANISRIKRGGSHESHI